MSGYVTHEREVEEEREPGDTAAVRRTIGPEAGAERLEQRVIRFGAGRSRPRSPGPHKQEILYVAAGSCFHLPPDHVHCIENDGEGVMRIMGVFHPSGDPASRSYDEVETTTT